MGYIYKVTNTINGKVYIGQTIRTIPVRWGEHVKNSIYKGKSYNAILHRAIRKYGVESFAVEEVEQCDDELLAERETYWIKHYNSANGGYNILLGSKGCHKCYDEDILREWNCGKNISQIAKDLSMSHGSISIRLKKFGISEEEIRERGCKTANHKKQKVYQYDRAGNFIREFESRRAAQEAVGAWLIISPKTDGYLLSGYQWRTYKVDNVGMSLRYAEIERAKQAKLDRKKNRVYKYNPRNSRKVAQFNMNWEYIQSFECVRAAARAVNGNHVAIGHALAGRTESSSGYHWMYLEDAERLGLVI